MILESSLKHIKRNGTALQFLKRNFCTPLNASLVELQLYELLTKICIIAIHAEFGVQLDGYAIY